MFSADIISLNRKDTIRKQGRNDLGSLVEFNLSEMKKPTTASGEISSWVFLPENIPLLLMHPYRSKERRMFSEIEDFFFAGYDDFKISDLI